MKIDDQLIERYLDRVMLIADRRKADAEDVRQELADHLYAKKAALMESGFSLENAVMTTLRESGRPMLIGYRLREPWRLVDVRAHGVARGVIALGPKAVGIIAFGGQAYGVVAMGGISVGLISLGGLAIGGVVFGGLGLGAYVLAGMAAGLIAYGGASMGLFAGGTVTLGWLGDLSEKLPPILQRGDIPALANLFIYLMAVYAILIVIGTTIQWRESRRVKPLSDDDWLFE